MNILVAIFLRVVAVYLAISIFNCINFVRCADTLNGYKSPWHWRKLRAVLRFGFAWGKPAKFWLLNWYLGLFKPEMMMELMKGAKARS